MNPELQKQRMLEAIQRAAESDLNLDPIWDCQVVCAVNKKSKLSRIELNKFLQARLNRSPAIKGSPFRLGDKVVNTKNGFFPTVEIDIDDPDTQTNSKGDVYVANGELAEVIEVQEKLIIAKLTKPDRVIKIPRGKIEKDTGKDDKPNTGCSWDLGYALSVHKSQGSEWPVVIVMIDEYPGARMVCSREWLYTAISRAKLRCVLIGKKSTADRFCRNVAIGKRKTFLKEQILLRKVERELVEL